AGDAAHAQLLRHGRRRSRRPGGGQRPRAVGGVRGPHVSAGRPLGARQHGVPRGGRAGRRGPVASSGRAAHGQQRHPSHPPGAGAPGGERRPGGGPAAHRAAEEHGGRRPDRPDPAALAG
ncbi:unnamed protein product, partial [Prorocentrum cordatum]